MVKRQRIYISSILYLLLFNKVGISLSNSLMVVFEWYAHGIFMTEDSSAVIYSIIKTANLSFSLTGNNIYDLAYNSGN